VRSVNLLVGPATGPIARLVGREPEEERLRTFLDSVPDGARALLIRGEPGIGKTALWRAGIERCDGIRVLVTRPAEEEMPLGLGALVDLLEHAGVDTRALLAEDNPFARGRAVLTALRRLAEDGPIVIAIDDLQWLDHASSRALRYALRRLDREPVGVLASIRAGAEDPLAAADNLPGGRCEVLEIGPLTCAALRRVLDGVVEAISRPALIRIHEVSAGNPLYAIALARHPAGRPLPDSLQGAIAERLEAVDAEIAELLRALSALGPATVRELCDAVRGAEALVLAAESQGLVAVDDDLRVRFSHPLIGSVVYGRMSPLVRRSLHARLAEASADLDVRARHLALSTDERDPEVAQMLEDAAARARVREAYALSADFVAHSLRLTDPADQEAALRRALAEIEDRGTAGEMSRALALADRLVAALPQGSARAEALVCRSYLDDDPVEVAVERLRAALDDVGPDGELRANVLDQLGWSLAMFQGRLGAGLECIRESVALTNDPWLQMHGTATLAYLEGLAGAPRPELMASALALEERIGKPILWTGPRTFQAELLLWSGDLAGARELFGEVHAATVRAGTTTHLPYSLFDLALVATAAGEFGEAEGFVRDGIEAARDAEDTWGQRLLLYPLALVDAWLGRADAARAAAARRLAEAQANGERPGEVRARGVLGLLALSEGDGEAAAVELRAAAELLDEMGFEHPGAFPVLPDAIEALACSGDVDGARELLSRLERQASEPWPLAAAERGRGVVALAEGDGDRAAEHLARAAAEFERLGHRPDAARAIFLAGRALLRANRRSQAAEALADARERFAALGAPLWEARVVGELERAAPGRASGELTPAERRIAERVAEGMRNREIGAALFMSIGTVEAHLTRIYRKLDIRSRSELARLVADGGV
jgi:DNA-binding CsgD family transcriptional regulator